MELLIHSNPGKIKFRGKICEVSPKLTIFKTKILARYQFKNQATDYKPTFKNIILRNVILDIN